MTKINVVSECAQLLQLIINERTLKFLLFCCFSSDLSGDGPRSGWGAGHGLAGDLSEGQSGGLMYTCRGHTLAHDAGRTGSVVSLAVGGAPCRRCSAATSPPTGPREAADAYRFPGDAVQGPHSVPQGSDLCSEIQKVT